MILLDIEGGISEFTRACKLCVTYDTLIFMIALISGSMVCSILISKIQLCCPFLALLCITF